MPDDLPNTNTDTTLAKNFSNWDYAKTKLVQLKETWGSGEAAVTQTRRDIREIAVDVTVERAAGDLEPDETFVPVRIIDSNITKEAGPFVQYISQSPRQVVMKPRMGGRIDLRERENEFTRVMRYEGWIDPFLKVRDGAATHGWDSVEVIFDATKPGHVAIEHISHDELWIPQDTRNIQYCEFIVREFQLSVVALREMIKTAQFNSEYVEKLLTKAKTDSGLNTESVGNTLIQVCKVMWKQDGVVMFAWWSSDITDGWLNGTAQKLYLGKKQAVSKVDAQGQEQITFEGEEAKIYEKDYPTFILFYRESEKPQVFERKGRVFLDEPKQDAATSLMTSFVNTTIRSGIFYGSLEKDDGRSGTLEAIKNLQIENGKIYNKPIKFSSIPAPDASLLRGIAAIQSLNADETNTPAFAVQARKDSKKSATEINAAQDQQAAMSGVTLVMQSSFLVGVYTLCDLIVTSRALAGLIDYCVGPDGKNNEALLSVPVILLPAGDVDVVEREKRLLAMSTAWPVIQNTPIARMFLGDMLRLSFPLDGERYAQALEEGDPKTQLIHSIMDTLAKLVTDPNTGQLQPFAQPFAPQIQQLVQQVQVALAPPGTPPPTNES